MAELSVASNTAHQSLFLETHQQPQTMTSCFSPSCLLSLSGHLCWLLSSAHRLPELPRSPSPQEPKALRGQALPPSPPSPGAHFALQQQETNPNTGRRPNRLRPSLATCFPQPGPARAAPFCCDLESQLIKLSDPSLPTAEKTLSKHL